MLTLTTRTERSGSFLFRFVRSIDLSIADFLLNADIRMPFYQRNGLRRQKPTVISPLSSPIEFLLRDGRRRIETISLSLSLADKGRVAIPSRRNPSRSESEMIRARY